MKKCFGNFLESLHRIANNSLTIVAIGLAFLLGAGSMAVAAGQTPSGVSYAVSTDVQPVAGDPATTQLCKEEASIAVSAYLTTSEYNEIASCEAPVKAADFDRSYVECYGSHVANYDLIQGGINKARKADLISDQDVESMMGQLDNLLTFYQVSTVCGFQPSMQNLHNPLPAPQVSVS